jgi:hypothetical protein
MRKDGFLLNSKNWFQNINIKFLALQLQWYTNSGRNCTIHEWKTRGLSIDVEVKYIEILPWAICGVSVYVCIIDRGELSQ